MRKRSMIALMALSAACGRSTARSDSTRSDSVGQTPTVASTSDTARKSPPVVPPTAVSASEPANKKSGSADAGVGKKTKMSPTGQPRSDTARGIISVNGTERDKHTMLAPVGGGRHVEITGPLATMIGRTAGADVWVSGTLSGTSLEATQFVVRTVDGAPAIDGTLRIENGVTWLVPASGARVRISSPPPAFRSLDGARVWITGDPARGVASYGRIDPAR